MLSNVQAKEVEDGCDPSRAPGERQDQKNTKCSHFQVLKRW